VLAISSTNSASPSLQTSLNSARLQQARQEADQAERVAQDLRSQVNQAEVDASKGQEKVRQLSSTGQATQSTPPSGDPTYTAARNQQAPEVAPKTQDFLLRMYTATSQKFASSGNALKTNPDAAPVVNTRGQATGRILNIKA
jgi:type II secretory pathway pseudopilin PulG